MTPWFMPRRLILLLALPLAISAALTIVFLERSPSGIDFAVTAHRAGGGLAPENSLSGIERSIAAGADFIEIDVQATRDGVVVAFHDADLMRLAGDPRRIKEIDFSDLAGVDIGSRYDPLFTGERIPTLAECLDRARGRIGVKIELKFFGFDPSLAGQCVKLVREKGMEGQVAMMSFHPEAVRQIREMAPEIPVGLLSAVSVGDLAGSDVDFIAVPVSRAKPALMRAARRRGLDVHVWGPKRPEQMISLIRRGAAGIITLRPDVAVKLRAQLRELSPAEILLLSFGRSWEEPADKEPGDASLSGEEEETF